MTSSQFVTQAAGGPELSHDVGYSERLLLLAGTVLPPIGATLILLAYHHAAPLAEPDQTQFALYWAGYLGGILPIVAVAWTTRSDVTRTCALAGIGLFGMVPKLIRAPGGPLDSDEFSHFRQTIEAFISGDVGHASYLIAIIKEFPGLHQAVSAFARLTGLPLWPAGMTVVALAHVLSVLATYQLVRAVGASAQGAAVGAVIYTLNPSWACFHTGVSYESLALPMLLWCLAAAVAASRGPERPDLRYIAVPVLCAVALPMIHHLTTIILCLILVLLIVTGFVHQVRWGAAGDGETRGERLWPLLVTASSLLVSIAFWWSDKYEWIVSYLGPNLTRGWTQLSQLLSLTGRTPAESSGERAPFGGAQNPMYEIVSGFLFPVVVLVLFLASVAVLWRNRGRLGSAPWAFALLGATYFLSMPMVLTKGGGEGAHRSWGFSFIGIAVLAGLAWSLKPPSVARAFSRYVTRFGGTKVRVGVLGVLGVAVSVMVVGSQALGTNVPTRFPGSVIVGDDTRSISREGAAVTAWMAAHTPVDTPVVADRYVSLQLGSVGRMGSLKPSAPFPVWDLYMSAGPVRSDVLKQILDARISYFVVDARMATTRPRTGYWFTKDEPGTDGAEVFPQAAIDRFNCLPWLRASYAAGPLTVYQVNPDLLRRTMVGSCGNRGA